ncbi:MAG: 6,7-dimethyl-8-ribityllumazine synthase [Acidimicrobiia bacterium]|nr:6,7-dimethyl-8-ribityllumazine synthase [Acidimicrobiia bacterium]
MRIIDGTPTAAGLRVALVVSKYHDFVTDKLQQGALAALDAARVTAVTVVKVPGAFEIPTAARQAADTRRFDAVVCLGCLIRGATPHFDFIAAAVAHGLVAASGESGVPMSFGVLTTNSAEEALARASEGPSNKGFEAALAAIEMATIARALHGTERQEG